MVVGGANYEIAQMTGANVFQTDTFIQALTSATGCDNLIVLFL